MLVFIVFLFALASLFMHVPLAYCETADGETRGIPLLPDLAEGVPIGLVYVHLEASSGDLDQDNKLKQRVLNEAGQASMSIGAPFNRFFADLAVMRIRQASGVKTVRYGVYQADKAVERIVVVFFVEPVVGRAEPAKEPSGMLPSGTYRVFL